MEPENTAYELCQRFTQTFALNFAETSSAAGAFIYSIWNEPLSMSLLAAVNAIGLGLFVGGLTLYNSPLGRDTFQGAPEEKDTFGQVAESRYRTAGIRTTVFVAMIIVGFACLLSTFFLLLLRPEAKDCLDGCEVRGDATLLVMASNTTMLGMLFTIPYACIEFLRLGSRTTALPRIANAPPADPKRTSA